MSTYRTQMGHDGQLVVNTAELFPDLPKGMVVAQAEGGDLVYGGVLHRVVARVIRRSHERDPGAGPSGLHIWSRNARFGWWTYTDILLVEPVE